MKLYPEEIIGLVAAVALLLLLFGSSWRPQVSGGTTRRTLLQGQLWDSSKAKPKTPRVWRKSPTPQRAPR